MLGISRAYAPIDSKPILNSDLRPVERARTGHDIGFHKEMVLKGAGVAILPEFLVAAELKKGLLKEVLPGAKYRWGLHLVKHKHRPLSPAAQEFLSRFRAFVDGFA